jgi:Flp pilus assembly protein TadG
LAGHESGNALVELATFFAFLGLPLLLGTAEMGIMVYDSIEVSNAAHAGAAYAMQSLIYSANTAGIIAAAQAEASDFGGKLVVVPVTYFVCSTAIAGTQYTGVNAQTIARLTCTGGTNHPIQFVQVSTSISVASLIHCPGLPQTFQLSGSSVMEVEQ